MARHFKQSGSILIAVITAVAILLSAYLLKGTEYENVWLYVLFVGLILSAAWEVFLKKTNKDH